MKSSLTIPFAIIAGGSIIALAVYMSMVKNPSPTSSKGDSTLVRPVDASDHIFGNPAAKVKIVEYSDFDCSYCKGFNDTLHQIIVNEGIQGDVAWILREFPLTEIHPHAMKHAEAAECIATVAGNTAFWKFEDILFLNQPVDPTQYGTYAKEIGINDDAFATCFANATKTVDARINADRQNALSMGAQGTPYSLILVAGKAPVVINGTYPYDVVKQLVDQALAGVSR